MLWTWAADGEVGSLAQAVALEPLVYRYGLQVPPPPEPEGGSVERDLPTDVAILVGLPILVEPTGTDAMAVQGDAEGLMAWALDEPGHRAGVAEVAGGATVAVTRSHLVVLAAWEGTAERLGEVLPGAYWCALSEVRPGMTLYRDTLGPGQPGGCGRWEPLADPGEQSEFQGIPMGD